MSMEIVNAATGEALKFEPLAPEHVYIGVVEHKHGTNTYAHRTEEGAILSVANYCREWFDEEIPDEDMPESANDVIQMYFEYVESEWYSINYSEVLP